MRRAGLLVVLLLGVSLHRAAYAEDMQNTKEITDDVRCIVVGLQAAQTTDPARQQSAAMVAMYFLGRLDAIAPQAHLEELMMSESASMHEPAVLQAEATRCGKTLVDKSTMMRRVGNQLMQPGKEMPEKEASPLP